MRDVSRKIIVGSMVVVLCVAMVAAFAGCKEKTALAEICPPDCTKPCCEGKDAAATTCSVDCTKTCSADEDAATEAKTCGPDCTKPCCADEDAEAKTCGPDCTKPCCADKDVVEKVVESTVNTAEQTTCPVMGGKINKEIFVEYKGKKVYFCCGGCDTKFQADPEKYIAKLPQFKSE
ncbi:MAG: YHS domain-containing protein [Anaerohalosphaera sp.]|nr:YHS domain-containing protein [Anaerohalosphaera sp.]